MSYYHDEAMSDAAETVRNYMEQIVDRLMDCDKVSDDLLNDYPNGDSYHHENRVDKEYSLTEADEILDTLSKYEEDDDGLWSGQLPREAISTQAAYTYGNAVYGMWRDFINDINKYDFEADAPEGVDETEEDKRKRIETTIENDILN